MAMDHLPIAVDPTEDFGDTNAHLDRLRHVADLHAGNLKPGPESDAAGFALLQDVEVAAAVVVECHGVSGYEANAVEAAVARLRNDLSRDGVICERDLPQEEGKGSRCDARDPQ